VKSSAFYFVKNKSRTVHKKGCENAPRGKRRGKKQGERPEFCNYNVAPYDDNTAAMGSRVPA